MSKQVTGWNVLRKATSTLSNPTERSRIKNISPVFENEEVTVDYRENNYSGVVNTGNRLPGNK